MVVIFYQIVFSGRSSNRHRAISLPPTLELFNPLRIRLGVCVVVMGEQMSGGQDDDDLHCPLITSTAWQFAKVID